MLNTVMRGQEAKRIGCAQHLSALGRAVQLIPRVVEKHQVIIISTIDIELLLEDEAQDRRCASFSRRCPCGLQPKLIAGTISSHKQLLW